MDYEELRRIQRLEKNNATLAQIPGDFYTQLGEYINGLVINYKEKGSGNDIRMMENVVRISKDIHQRRTQKMLMYALRTFNDSESKPIALVEIEKQCYGGIVQGLENMGDEFDNVLTGERPVSGTRIQEEADKTLGQIGEIEEEQALNTVLLRILKEIPKFVSSDMQEYGPFKSHDMIKMSEKEAQLLIDKGFAEKV